MRRHDNNAPKRSISREKHSRKWFPFTLKLTSHTPFSNQKPTSLQKIEKEAGTPTKKKLVKIRNDHLLEQLSLPSSADGWHSAKFGGKKSFEKNVRGRQVKLTNGQTISINY